MKKSLVIAVMVFVSFNIYAEPKLKPGFDAKECANMLQLAAMQPADSPWVNTMLPKPDGYTLVYRSDTVGLDNRWDLWLRDDSVAVISIRGTTKSPESWVEDFYSPMVPATGSMNIGNNKIFTYQLAADNNAYIHTGFLLGLGYLAPDIVAKINEYYAKGIKEFILTGYSQGGALILLMTSYLYYLPPGQLPQDIQFKTYACAPPKPGNLFYAYDYEFIRRGGWEYRVVNVEDWVPNMPPTVQTRFDYKTNDPFTTVDSLLKENLNIFERIVVGLIQKSMLGSLDNARDNLIKYMGEEVYKMVVKYLPGFPEPQYSPTMYFMTCGTPIVLRPTEEYLAKFVSPGGIAGMFIHHMPNAYYFLLDKWYSVSGK
jgi:hypothetical protein